MRKGGERRGEEREGGFAAGGRSPPGLLPPFTILAARLRAAAGGRTPPRRRLSPTARGGAGPPPAWCPLPSAQRSGLPPASLVSLCFCPEQGEEKRPGPPPPAGEWRLSLPPPPRFCFFLEPLSRFLPSSQTPKQQLPPLHLQGEAVTTAAAAPRGRSGGRRRGTGPHRHAPPAAVGRSVRQSVSQSVSRFPAAGQAGPPHQPRRGRRAAGPARPSPALSPAAGAQRQR